MIYDVLADFNAGDVKYNKDTTDPRVPIDSLSQFYNNKIKIETTKIKDMEKALSEYSTLTDEVLGIEVHNEDQYKRMKDLRMKYNITDDIYPTDIKDLSNTAKLTQAKSKLKRYVGSPEMKMIFDEQKKGNDYRAKAVEIMSMNEPLGILAMKDYLEKYGNKSEKSYTGFDLNINDYVPMDVDDEIAKLAASIEKEYRLEKDPTSPTGDGYLFVNKISEATEDGRAIFERKMNALRNNRRFDNNMKSYIAMNSPETDYNDPDAYSDFVTEMMNTHLGPKVVSTDVKKIDAKVVLGEGGSGSGTSSGSSTPIKDTRTTESERLAYLTRDVLERNPNYKDYDFEGLELSVMGMPKGYFKAKDEIVDEKINGKPTGNKILQVTFSNGKQGEEVKITVPKISEGGKRSTLAEMEAAQSSSSSPASSTTSNANTPQNTEDVTMNNPERAKHVSGLKKGEGKYLEDGTWVVNTKSGKIPVVPDAVNLQREGLKVKVGVGHPAENYHLTRSTTNKAKEFVAGIGDYMITEAGTDTISKGHSNKKHYDGTAFDMSLQGQDSRDIDRLFNVMLEAKKAGLDAQYESKEKSVVDALNERIQVWNVQNKKNKLKPAANWPYAPHFSVYDNDPFIPVKSGQVPALDIASPKKNEDYYNFVQSNQLDKRPMQDVVQLNTTYLQTKHKPVYEALKESDVNQKISEIQNKLTNSNLSEGERERLNVELTKNKDRLKNLDKEVPNFGDVQTAMSIVAQSPEMANYMNNNPKEVQDIIKFTKSPNVQESLMDYTLANVYYPIMTSIPDNNKFDKQEQILLLHVMGDTGGKEAIMGKRPIRTGLQMLKDYGFIVNGVNGKPKPNLDINKYNNIVKKLNEISQGEVSLFKLAWKELKGEIPDNISDKELIELNESDGRKDQYGTVNATTTAIGKYQFMWKLHKGIIKKLLEDYEPTAEETEQMDVSSPPEMKGDSISNADRFK